MGVLGLLRVMLLAVCLAAAAAAQQQDLGVQAPLPFWIEEASGPQQLQQQLLLLMVVVVIDSPGWAGNFQYLASYQPVLLISEVEVDITTAVEERTEPHRADLILSVTHSSQRLEEDFTTTTISSSWGEAAVSPPPAEVRSL